MNGRERVSSLIFPITPHHSSCYYQSTHARQTAASRVIKENTVAIPQHNVSSIWSILVLGHHQNYSYVSVDRRKTSGAVHVVGGQRLNEKQIGRDTKGFPLWQMFIFFFSLLKTTVVLINQRACSLLAFELNASTTIWDSLICCRHSCPPNSLF